MMCTDSAGETETFQLLFLFFLPEVPYFLLSARRVAII
jgi:hypothetical protein